MIARADVGCEYAPGDVCPDCEDGRLRERTCHHCGGDWFTHNGVTQWKCRRCDLGYVFFCDSCEWSS